jgi:hypothetical protein
MDKEIRGGMKKRKIWIRISIVSIIICSILLAIGLHVQFSSNIIFEDEYGTEDISWSPIDGDELLWSIENNMQRFDGEIIENLARSYSFLQMKIQSLNDLGYDVDSISDLIFTSQLLMGDAKSINFELPIETDIYKFNPFFGTLGEIINQANGVVDNNQWHRHFTFMNNFHVSFSEFYTNLLNLIEYTIFNDGYSPTFAYEYFDHYTPFVKSNNTHIFLNSTEKNKINYVSLFEERNFSKGYEFEIDEHYDLSEQNITSLYHPIDTADFHLFVDGSTHYNYSFWVYPERNISLVFDICANDLPINDQRRRVFNGHHFKFYNNSVYRTIKEYYQHSDQTVTFNSSVGWVKVADVPSEKWNFIELSLPRSMTHNNNATIRVNNGNITTFNEGYNPSFSGYRNISFSIDGADKNGEVYIDDLWSDFDPQILLSEDHFDLGNNFLLFGYFSFGSIFILPTWFDYELLGGFLLDQIINFRGINGTEREAFLSENQYIIQDDEKFQVSFDNELINEIFNEGLGIQLEFFEGETEINLAVEFDKKLGFLTYFQMTIYYVDLGIRNNIVIRLLKTISKLDSINGYYIDQGGTRIFNQIVISSKLNEDEYPNQINVDEFDDFLLDAFDIYIEEFGYDPIMERFFNTYQTQIIWIGIGIFSGMSGITFLAIYLINRKRKIF